MAGQSSRQRGFTIIELLVATVVFSVVLIVITVGIIQIGRVYYKGVTETNTQNTARQIMDVISQSIQFSGNSVTGTPTAPPPIAPNTDYRFCVGNEQYSYRLGSQLVDSSPQANQSYHVLVKQTAPGCPAPQTLTSQSVAGRELMGPNMRLSNLVVTPLPNNAYQILVRVVYGDDDLLKNPTGTDAACLNVSAGTQFCAVSELTTVVVKRVN